MILTTAGKATAAVAVIVVGAIATVIAQIPRPESFWFQTWAGWGTLFGLILTCAAVLALAKKVLGPTQGENLRRGLEEPDTRRVLKEIAEKDWADEIRRREATFAQMRKEIDAVQDSVGFLQTVATQQGEALRQMPSLVKTLGRIEYQLEMQTKAMEAFAKKAEQVDRLESRLDERDRWDHIERRKTPRE